MAYTENDYTFGDILTEAKARNGDTQYKNARHVARPLGGLHLEGVASDSYVDLPGAIVVPIGDASTAQLHAMGFVTGGTGTCRLVDLGGPTTIGVTSSSVADPTVVTTDEAHDLETGDTVTLTGHSGSTPDINGVDQAVTVISPTTFSLDGVAVTVGGTGGTIVRTNEREVSGSETTFTETAPTLQETGDLSLAAGGQYKAQVKISVTTETAFLYGAALVSQ